LGLHFGNAWRVPSGQDGLFDFGLRRRLPFEDNFVGTFLDDQVRDVSFVSLDPVFDAVGDVAE